MIDGHGNAYVNRAGFNPMTGEEFQPGFVFLAAADGSVRQVAGNIAFPNGMTVTADNSTLIVADSYRHHLVAFDIGADGGLSGRRAWAHLGEGPRRYLRRRAGRRLVRRRAEQAVRAGGRGRHGAAGRRAGPRRLRLRPWRAGAENAVHRGCRMAGHDRIRDGGARQRAGICR